MIITHTRDVLIKFIAPSSLAQLELDLVSRVVVSAVPSLEERLIKVLRKSPELRSVQIEGIRLNHEEERSPEVDHLDYAMALALGALVETDSLYSIDAIDLSITPQEQLEQISQSHQIIEAAQEEKKARKARLAMAAPLVVVAAFLLTTWFQYRVEGASLLSKIDSEHETAGQLRQVTTDYESSRKNFGMFKILLDNLISLRERQPATHQLLRDLNSRWPKDASWSISEIDVKGGNVEIKGRTRNEQAITAFAKALEFSDGLFSNILTSNNVAGTSLTGTTASTTAAPQSSGVFEFTVRANYSPLKTPGQAPTAAIQAPAVSTPSVPAATSQTQTALPQNLILPPALATPANSQQVAGR